MTREFRELRDRRAGLPPPQFSLLALLLLTASVAGLIVLAQYAGPLAAGVALIAILSIVAHVASTAIGGRLRQGRSAILPSDEATEPALRQPVQAQPSDFAKATELSHKKALDRRPIVWAVGAGAALAALLGGGILTVVLWEDFSVVNILFGAGSSAVLGGIFGFWLGSLFQVARSALAEAQKDG